jgi:hypothetical protein
LIRALGRLMGMRYLERNELMAIAHRHCAELGWPWAEPILVKEGLLSTSIHTKADHKGGNIFLRISARTGRIEYSFFAQR